MKLFDIYKETSSGRSFLLRVAAVEEDHILPNLPELLAEQRYLAPQEVADRAAYFAAVEEFEEVARREGHTYRGIVAREAAYALRRTLEQMEALEVPE